MWDHRGGSLWEKKQNFNDLRTVLESKDIAKVKALFTPDCGFDPVMKNPSHVPVGRIVIDLPNKLKNVTLDTESGIIEVICAAGKNTEKHYLFARY
ncbi:MAG: hypothetical protein IKA71_05490 [Lentisphaeria bacterium]|nr:hypothetical protein [Lentisphaeria bacterium]